MDKKEHIERIKEIEKQQTLCDELFAEDIPKSKHFAIRMDITMDRVMPFEEAEKVIFSALRSAGMRAHKGGID